MINLLIFKKILKKMSQIKIKLKFIKNKIINFQKKLLKMINNYNLI